DFSEAKVALDVSRIKSIDSTTPGDFDPSFKKCEGLFGKNGFFRLLCFAKILWALKIARFPVATAVPSRLSLHPRAPRISPEERLRSIPVYIRMKEPGRFRDATLLRIR